VRFIIANERIIRGDARRDEHTAISVDAL